MLEDADKGVTAELEVLPITAPHPSKRQLKRCPSLPISASRAKLDAEDDGALEELAKLQAELEGDAAF